MLRTVGNLFDKSTTQIAIFAMVLMTAAVSQGVVALGSSSTLSNCPGGGCNTLIGPQCADPCVCYIIRGASGVCKLVGS